MLLGSAPLGSWLAGNSLAANDPPQALRPSAILAGRDNTVLVSDASEGIILRVDLADAKVTHQWQIAESLVDMASVAENRFVALDGQGRQLILCHDAASGVGELHRVDLQLDPRRVALGHGGDLLCVSGCWAQAVQPLRIVHDQLQAMPRIDIGFPAQEILALDDHRFLVADAFGGRLAVVDAATRTVVATRNLAGHNLRGLARSAAASTVLISHQVLSRVARADLDDIHWGSLIQNVITRVRIASLTDPQFKGDATLAPFPLGDTGNGFADPTAVAATSDRWMVLSGGTGALRIYQQDNLLHTIATGRRPTRLVAIGNDQIVILNEHDVALTQVTMDDVPRVQRIELTSAAPPQSQGEVAFYDATLSHDSWMTCNSCHVDGHTPESFADTLGDGAFGNPKRIPTLMGIRETAPFGWLGNKRDLREQVNATLATTMRGKPPEPHVAAALVDYLRQLPPPPLTESDKSKDLDAARQQNLAAGRQLFVKLQCNSCHSPPRYTSHQVQDVGLRDELGNRQFNPPSLRGLRFRRVFFHDGRAATLAAVFFEHRHQITADLSPTQWQQMFAFLQSL